MDIEELNKTQIVLLTLLVSFITSIATGIVTVTLIDQAPPAVTSTINRVVERTIERVIPAEIGGGKETVVIEKEVTIVIKEEDLITDSIEKNRNSLVRLFTTVENVTRGKNGKLESVEVIVESSFVGLGIVISPEGMIATDHDVALVSSDLKVLTSTGKIFHTKRIDVSSEFNTGLLQIIQDENNIGTFSHVVFMGEDSVKLGQSVIALGGKDRTNVSIGIISDLIYEEVETSSGEEETKTIEILKSIGTSINSKNIVGSPILNIFGEVIGIKTFSNSSGSYTPIHFIESQVSLIASTANKEVVESNNN